jgi:hypothetical protein
VPRIVLSVEGLNAAVLIRTAEFAAEGQEYRVIDGRDDRVIHVQKGSFAASFFLGAFVLYCNFRVSVERGRLDERELRIEWDTPWWAGFFGVERTATAAGKYADEIEDLIEEAGGRVEDRRKT